MNTQYRKRPLLIHAMLVSAIFATPAEERPDWITSATEAGVLSEDGERFYVETLEGKMTAGPDDWLICGIGGELYPCKPDIFEATYEAVEDDEGEEDEPTGTGNTGEGEKSDAPPEN